jgi:transposase
MLGADEQSGAMFTLEERVPPDHPLRAIRRITDRALAQLSPQFGRLYIHFGRPSVPPEKLLRALLLQALYTIRSERQLMEQLDYNLLFSLVRGLGHRCPRLGANHVQQEPRSAAHGRHRRGVF